MKVTLDDDDLCEERVVEEGETHMLLVPRKEVMLCII